MSLVNFTSGINKIEEERPLSEWALEYISLEKITRENHARLDCFQSLTRRQKDAIRYQLRKTSQVRNKLIKNENQDLKKQKVIKEKSNLAQRLRIALSVWISCFLLVDIAQIYIAKGMGSFLAWQTAILVELCILAGSACRERRIQKTAYAFLVYNIALFAFFEVNELHKAYVQNNIASSAIYRNDQAKDTLGKGLEFASKIHEKNLGDMSKLVGKGYVSSVSNAVSSINTSFNKKTESTMGQLAKLEAESNALKAQHKNIFLLGAVSLLYFFLRCILQTFSIWLIRKESV